MVYDPRRHHRRSIRKKGHDYTAPGVYYITICIEQRAHILSQIVNGNIQLQTAGKLVETTWHRLPDHFAAVRLDAFVIMPDHIHGIIILRKNKRPKARKQSERANGSIPGSIPAIVQNFKSISARQINKARGTPGQKVWQEDYYDRIIRNEADLEHTRRYIAANPSRWRQ